MEVESRFEFCNKKKKEGERRSEQIRFDGGWGFDDASRLVACDCDCFLVQIN